MEAGKLERALDLVDRLHLEKSYDLAMRIADKYTKLVDLIEDARDNRFPPEEEDGLDDEQDDGYDEAEDGYVVNSSPQGKSAQASRRISPESSANAKRGFYGGEQERNVRARAF